DFHERVGYAPVVLEIGEELEELAALPGQGADGPDRFAVPHAPSASRRPGFLRKSWRADDANAVVRHKGGRNVNQQNPARVYVGVVGPVLIAAGIIGFFYSSDFGSPGKVDAVFGILDVNAWHNIVHLATGGLALLAFAAGAYASRAYALAF